MRADVYNFKNEKVGEIEAPESVFGVKWNPLLVKQALLAQLANRRRPWAHAKTRGEVRGGGKKPWRQKGTGRARHGSIRSPIWIGGGKAHGPRKDRDYSQKLNKKMKRLALLSVISKKFKDGEVKIMEDLGLSQPKTKLMAANLKSLLGEKRLKKADMLFVPSSDNKNIYRASRNLVKAKVLDPESLNVYDLLNYKRILLDQKAVAAIAKHYAPKK
jgi:large subunit ribosomal protein L4